jgi:hypothetical protein
MIAVLNLAGSMFDNRNFRSISVIGSDQHLVDAAMTGRHSDP